MIILCVIDFSASTVKVLEFGVKMALACQGEPIVLYPYRLIDNEVLQDVQKLRTKLETQAFKKYEELISSMDVLKETPPFIPEIGFPSQRILSYATKLNPGMVVLGEGHANSIHEMKKDWMTKFLRELRIPLLIVPEAIPA